ncbi:tRNA (adenine(22)-N(1))-methyltransferase [Desulfuribacillus alkaliarsenatis]|uniref:SAM-dependent methyltransferase n=1 Tax=Desulfuribacillus alkaliarsenatis TaxID=766136 RepID=A0A1E5G0H7_9FIRM|nr:class I SAM-dependent methyltransferase [Desulfuribacillus alkaliarsenatis]OEF96209.1 hypothetical protein BHF68_08555 [Desulfuribacillus alkaliarsenatis]
MLSISTRLKMIVDYIPDGEVLVDVGTDHAYLPLYAIKKKNLQKVIAGEYNKGPYLRAVANVEQQKLADKIQVRLGNGLEVIEKNEATVLTIAGMGGNLITEILNDGYDKLSSFKRLILQPMNGEFALRKWLQEHNYTIIAEQIIKEQDIIYEIIVAEPSETSVHLTVKQQKFGPLLMLEKNAVFLEKWSQELQKRQKILSLIAEHANNQAIETKQERLNSEIQMIREVLGNA